MQPKKLRPTEIYTLQQMCGGDEIPKETMKLAERVNARISMATGSGLDYGDMALIAEIGSTMQPSESEVTEGSETDPPAARRNRK